MNTALLMLDYQVGLCEQGPHLKVPPLAAQVAARGVVPTAERVLAGARRAGWFTVHTRLAFEPTYRLRTNRLARFDAYEANRGMLADSPEAQILGSLKPRETEPVIDKRCVNPFIGTALRDMLAIEGITEVVLGGVATNLVVESTARHASDSGLQVTIVEDMCASLDPELHRFAIDKILPLFGEITSSPKILDGMGVAS